MALPSIGDLVSHAALDRLDLVAEPVAEALRGWEHADQVAVVEIDPDAADTAAMNERYGTSPLDGANCVVVAGKRAGDVRTAACVVRADTRADVNRVVKRELDVRKASFLPTDQAVEESQMMYGGITPIGLPESWRILVAAEVVGIGAAIVGSGLRASKLLVPGRLIAELPNASVVDDLGVPSAPASN